MDCVHVANVTKFSHDHSTFIFVLEYSHGLFESILPPSFSLTRSHLLSPLSLSTPYKPSRYYSTLLLRNHNRIVES